MVVKMMQGFARQERRGRFFGVVNLVKLGRVRVAIVGTGALGSYTAMVLAKAGVRKFTLIDMDTVEEVNVGVQAYMARDVGEKKVRACAELLESVDMDGKLDIEVCARRFRGGAKGVEMLSRAGVVVASLDNIPTRRDVFNAAHARGVLDGRKVLLVDPRVSAGHVELNAIEVGRGGDKEHMARYAKRFHKDVPPMECGKEGAPYIGPICGGMVAGVVTQWVSGTLKGKELPCPVFLSVPEFRALR